MFNILIVQVRDFYLFFHAFQIIRPKSRCYSLLQKLVLINVHVVIEMFMNHLLVHKVQLIIFKNKKKGFFMAYGYKLVPVRIHCLRFLSNRLSKDINF